MDRRLTQRFANHCDVTAVILKVADSGQCEDVVNRAQQQVQIKCLAFTGSAIAFSYQSYPCSRILQLDSPDKFLVADFSLLSFEDGENAAKSAGPQKSKKAVSRPEYINRILSAGITINQKKYHYLGQSNSQIKDRKCLLLQAGPDEIREKLNGFGDWDGFTSVAKLTKRIGLLFSAGQTVFTLPHQSIEKIEDVERGEHCFTDGCGFISGKLLTKLTKKMNLTFRNARHYPSVVQIRYRGFKGILLRGNHLSGEKCQFRKSMTKFNYKGPDDFCVVDYSKPYTFGRLNLQIIMLLWSLGVPDEVLIQKQQEHFERLDKMFTDMPLAFEYLLTNGEVTLANQLLEHGFTAKVLEYLQKLYNHELRTSLKEKRRSGGGQSDDGEKLRIIVKNSRLAFAAADPTEKLSQHQCFFRPTIDNKPYTITGKVFCVRNPCYHAGDIVVLDAVHLPQCDNIVDVLLFSVNGSRPAAHRSAGGDLDGDKFFVCWDEDLMPRQTVESYGYPANDERFIAKIGREDLIKHFAYHSNVGVSRCAEVFKKWADARGPRSEECVQINALFSHAVDGQTVNIPRALSLPPVVEEEEIQNKIWNRLVTLAQEYRFSVKNRKKILPVPLVMDEEHLHLFLEYDCQEATDYEIFNFLLGWCHANNKDIEDYVYYVNFENFTDRERLAVEATGKILRSHLFNALHESEILTGELKGEITRTYNRNWKLFHRRNGREVSASVISDLLTALSTFRQVFVLLRFDHELSVGFALNGTFRPDENNDACDKVKVYGFNPRGHFWRKKYCKDNFMIYFNDRMFRLYLADPVTKEYSYTFIWLGFQDKLPEGKGGATIVLNDLKLETSISVAIEKLGADLKNKTSKIRKEPIVTSEIYVIANRDNVRARYEVVNPDYDVTMEKTDYDRNYNPPDRNNPLCESDRQLLQCLENQRPSNNLGQLIERLTCWLKYGEEAASIKACETFLKNKRKTLKVEELFYFAAQNPVIHYPLAVCAAESSTNVTPDMAVCLIEACCRGSTSKGTLNMEEVGNLLASVAANLNVTHICSIVKSLVMDFHNTKTALLYAQGLFQVMDDKSSNTKSYFVQQLKMLCVETLEELQSQKVSSLNCYKASENRTEDARHRFTLTSVGSVSIRVRPGDLLLLKRLNRKTKESISCLRGLVVTVHPELTVEVSWIPRDMTIATWKIKQAGNVVGFKHSLAAISHLSQHVSPVVSHLVGETDKVVSEADDDHLPTEIRNLNESQNNAVATAKRRTLTLWQGPAGTGKTKTIYEFIVSLLDRSTDGLPVLLTAATNVAVDNVALLLRRRSDIDVVRIGDTKSIHEQLREITVEVAPDGKLRRTNYKQALEMIRAAQVICSTCVGCGSSLLDKIEYSFVVLDEASLVAEPLCLIPLAKKCQQFLLVGDHKQLRPFFHSLAVETGYSVSLFERIFDESNTCLLNTQYRMHPGIAHFPNTYFYDGKLRDGVDATSRPTVAGFPWPNPNIPVAFVQVSGNESVGGESKSNEAEVQCVIKTLVDILDAGDVGAADVGIISLYSAQLQKLKKALTTCKNSAVTAKVEVNTADGFQGREKQLIMITCVRCNHNGNIGFLDDPRRFNVMLTRARRGLVVFGDQKTLSNNSMWCDWFKWCKKNFLFAKN